jgi:hypothetical protein
MLAYELKELGNVVSSGSLRSYNPNLVLCIRDRNVSLKVLLGAIVGSTVFDGGERGVQNAVLGGSKK